MDGRAFHEHRVGPIRTLLGLPHSFWCPFLGIFYGKIGVVWWFAAACSWVSNVVCSSKIDMGMVMDLVVGFSIFAVRGGGDG